MINEKKCKGQNKAASFSGCGKMVNVNFRKHGLCLSCWPEFLTETEPGKLMMHRALFKVQKPRLEMELATKEKKDKTALKLAHERTKQIVHAYVRDRDIEKPCVSCNADWNADFQAGHFYPAGSFETLKYNLDNISGQCVKCNLFNEGNFENYSLNLPKRIGIDKYNALVNLAQIDKKAVKVWDVEKLKIIQNEIKNLRK